MKTRVLNHGKILTYSGDVLKFSLVVHFHVLFVIYEYPTVFYLKLTWQRIKADAVRGRCAAWLYSKYNNYYMVKLIGGTGHNQSTSKF